MRVMLGNGAGQFHDAIAAGHRTIGSLIGTSNMRQQEYEPRHDAEGRPRRSLLLSALRSSKKSHLQHAGGAYRSRECSVVQSGDLGPVSGRAGP